MVHQKNIGLQESVLLLVFFFCVGFVGGAEAIEMASPVSIHEILSSEQIEKVKASNALKAVRQGGGRKVMKNHIASNVPAMRKMMGMRLGRIMSSKISAQVEKKAAPKLETLDSESTVQTTSAFDATTKDE